MINDNGINNVVGIMKDGKEATSDHCWFSGKRYSCMECLRASRDNLKCMFASSKEADEKEPMIPPD